MDGASADIFAARNIEWEKGREWLLELCEGNDRLGGRERPSCVVM